MEADFVLITRFALFAAGLTFERDVDRLKPFVRLLLIGRKSQRAAHPWRAARGIGPQLTTDTPLNQRTQPFAGALLPKIRTNLSTNVSTEKNT